MRFILVLVLLTIISAGVPVAAQAAGFVNDTYKFGKNKGKKKLSSSDIQNGNQAQMIKILEAMHLSLEKNNTLVEKISKENKELANRLAKALSVIASLIKENNYLQEVKEKKPVKKKRAAKRKVESKRTAAPRHK